MLVLAEILSMIELGIADKYPNKYQCSVSTPNILWRRFLAYRIRDTISITDFHLWVCLGFSSFHA